MFLVWSVVLVNCIKRLILSFATYVPLFPFSCTMINDLQRKLNLKRKTSKLKCDITYTKRRTLKIIKNTVCWWTANTITWREAYSLSTWICLLDFFSSWFWDSSNVIPIWWVICYSHCLRIKKMLSTNQSTSVNKSLDSW